MSTPETVRPLRWASYGRAVYFRERLPRQQLLEHMAA